MQIKSELRVVEQRCCADLTGGSVVAMTALIGLWRMSPPTSCRKTTPLPPMGANQSSAVAGAAELSILCDLQGGGVARRQAVPLGRHSVALLQLGQRRHQASVGSVQTRDTLLLQQTKSASFFFKKKVTHH